MVCVYPTGDIRSKYFDVKYMCTWGDNASNILFIWKKLDIEFSLFVCDGYTIFKIDSIKWLIKSFMSSSISNWGTINFHDVHNVSLDLNNSSFCLHYF